jgi:hypothetical protein
VHVLDDDDLLAVGERLVADGVGILGGHFRFRVAIRLVDGHAVVRRGLGHHSARPIRMIGRGHVLLAATQRGEREEQPEHDAETRTGSREGHVVQCESTT